MEGDILRNRKPAVAGTFYPKSRENLHKTIENHFSAASPNRNLDNVKAIIAPHAGYIYSGTIAASAFNQLQPGHIYDNVFIIGSSHHASFDGASIFTQGNFITPLGIAKVNLDLTRELVSLHSEIFVNNPEVQNIEHSLEVQVPFLQFIYKEKLQIVPIIIATQNVKTIREIAVILFPFYNSNNLFLISTDFSHYPDYESAYTIDKHTANAILANSPDAFLSVLKENSLKGIPDLATSICGWTSVLTLLNITEKAAGTKYHAIAYKNSGDVSIGNREHVVGYYAIAVTDTPAEPIIKEEEAFLTQDDKMELLHIARDTIGKYLETGRIVDAGSTSSLTTRLLSPASAFVTLSKDKKLRGCIGHFNTDKPLFRVVQEMAVSAATRDYRFAGIEKEELDKIRIEISVLTPMRRIQSIKEIVLGKHGIYIKKGSSSGTFLPQVADQTDWNAEEFVSHCSRDKAGIGWDGWKEDAEIYVYEAYVFGDCKK
jgi:AmmeMemoRadiSam system protein B/AmmeMemoRadiSam system protein A